MIRKFISVGAAAALGALALTASVAMAQPSNPPARFAGTVTVNGSPAPSGTTVEARVGSTTCGTTQTFDQNGNANYVVDVPAADSENVGCGTDGATVTLYVNGAAAGSGPWRNFELNNVNLSTGGAATSTPSTTATPSGTATSTGTAVSTPRPPVTGSGLTDGGSSVNLLLVAAGLLVVTGAAGAAAATRRNRS